MLVLEPALYRNHLAAIVPPLALLAAVRRRGLHALLLVVLVLLVPWSAHNLQSILVPTGYRGDEAALMVRLQRSRRMRR